MLRETIKVSWIPLYSVKQHFARNNNNNNSNDNNTNNNNTNNNKTSNPSNAASKWGKASNGKNSIMEKGKDPEKKKVSLFLTNLHKQSNC